MMCWENRAHLTALFEQDLVVLAQGNAENDGSDIFEAMNPLLPLAPLPTHVEHAAKGGEHGVSIQPRGPDRVSENSLDAELPHLESRFVYTGRLGSRSEHIHLDGKIVRRHDPLGLLKETMAELAPPVPRKMGRERGNAEWVTYYSAESIK